MSGDTSVDIDTRLISLMFVKRIPVGVTFVTLVISNIIFGLEAC